MPMIEAKKRIHRSVRGPGLLAGNRRAEPVGGQPVRTGPPNRTGGEGLKQTVLGMLSLRPDALVSDLEADGSGTGIPWALYLQSCLRRLRTIMMSATNGWGTNMVVLAIASLAGGCLYTGTGDSETRLTASVYLEDSEEENCGSADPNGADAYYIVALITDKMRLASVNSADLLESSRTQVNSDFMQFFNWSDKDKFVTRSNIVIAPVKRGTDSSNGDKAKNGVILYPDRDPNGMLYIQLVLIKQSGSKDWMTELAWNSILTGTSRDGRRRLWPFLNDLSVQSGFTATILSEVENKDIVSWNTYSFFKKDGYAFLDDKPQGPRDFSLPIDCEFGEGNPTLHLKVTVSKPPLSQTS